MAVTGALALWPAAQPQPAPPHAHLPRLGKCVTPPSCSHAHALRIAGTVTGGASRVRIAGPIIYTDVTTDGSGRFDLTIPIRGDLCSLLPAPADFSFSDASMTIAYRIDFE
jgi:hypothetical protein